VGILNTKLKNCKIVLKGSKGLQMEFSRINSEPSITTDDIDLLIIPVGEYKRDIVENTANKLSLLIETLITQIYPSVTEYGIVSEGISILPTYIVKTNPNIVKMSYVFNKHSFAILDIDFKEDTERFFTEEKMIKTSMFLKQKNVKTYLSYHHQTLESFIKEKQAIKKKYTDCKCPTDVLAPPAADPPAAVPPSAVPTTAVPPTPECEPLCKEKQFILDKFQKYDPLIEEYEKRKTRLNQTQKQQSNKPPK
jgi:hypothetical protein